MKILLAGLLALLLTGCGDPVPMSDGTAKAFEKCLDKGWVPYYYSNMGRVTFTCNPYKNPIPMNAHSAKIMQACLEKDEENTAIYDAVTGRVMCVPKGGKIQIRD